MLNDLDHRPFDAVLGDLYKQTGLTFKDSFLYESDRELQRRLGVSFEL